LIRTPGVASGEVRKTVEVRGRFRHTAAAAARWLGMIEYPKHATTVIGAYSVPDWFEPLVRLPAVGQLSTAAMTDAQFRATQAAVLDQELAGIDVITRPEMQRRTHDRHSPPNAMLNHFWQRINAFQGSTRPKPTARHDPDGFHPAATCKGRVEEHIDRVGNKPIGIRGVGGQ